MLKLDELPEYKQSSLCTLHTKCSVEVPTVDGVDLLPCLAPSLLGLPQSLSQGRAPGLARLASGTGTQTGTNHKTGQTDRPDRTCTQSRNLSGRAPRTRRRSPGRTARNLKDVRNNKLENSFIEIRA